MLRAWNKPSPRSATREVDVEFYDQLLTCKVRYERLLACLSRLAARGHLPAAFVEEVREGGSDPDALALLLELPLKELAADPAPRVGRSPTRKLASLAEARSPAGWGLLVRDGRAQFPRRPSGRTPGRRFAAVPDTLPSNGAPDGTQVQPLAALDADSPSVPQPEDARC